MNPPGTNPYLFSDRVALVTGGTSGIGYAAVESFAKAGATTCYLGRRKDLGEQQAKKLREQGLGVEFFAADVTDEAQLKEVLSVIHDRHGRLDYAVNNAGLECETVGLVEESVEDFQRVMDVNVLGTFLSMKHEIPLMVAKGGGAIVNTASVLGQVGMPHMGAYVAAKHAVIGLTKVAALEHAADGVRINAICPGGVETDMLERSLGGNAEARKHVSSLHPMGRVASPYEIANAILWLCSEAASFVTGQAVPVDGGFSAQ